MGLYIIAYKGLKEEKHPIWDEDDELIDGQWTPGEDMNKSESIWPGRGIPLKSESVYHFEDKCVFSVGPCSLYNSWRRKLDSFKGNVAFQELINFSDCEGVIGSVIAEKLYNDFKNNYNEAIEYSKEISDFWFMEKYDIFMKAFEIAKENGAVVFD